MWGVLAGLFRVPREAPDLPVDSGESGDLGAELRRLRPSHGWLRLLKLKFWIALAAIDGGLLVVWLAILGGGHRTAALVTAPLFFVAIVLPDIVAYVAIHLRYDTTWYVLSGRSMRLRRGVMSVHETTITFENIQNVTVRQGPLLRWFGISDLQVETAGGGGGG
ncbi:MAG TPA: hypothetical protein DEB06_00680, partial [Phycisphaerales bacterium]|nr:hypothetical protein [Phycisphaerales bacterium]